MAIPDLSNIITCYTSIIQDCNIGQFGPPFAYYYNDEIESNILATSLIDIDVKSAFPTICKIIFGESHPFVKQIFNIENKLERNKFISITLTDQSKIDGKQYINELNIWSKILVFGYIYSRFDQVNILEYAKDGCLFSGVQKQFINQNDKTFLEFIKNNNVIYHEKGVDIYIRFNRTSIYVKDSVLKLKGNYRNLPPFINSIILKFLNGNIYESSLLTIIKKIYNPTYFKILYKANAHDLIKSYYEFENSYLDINGKLSSINNICVKSYLIFIVYPILSLMRLKIHR